MWVNRSPSIIDKLDAGAGRSGSALSVEVQQASISLNNRRVHAQGGRPLLSLIKISFPVACSTVVWQLSFYTVF